MMYCLYKLLILCITLFMYHIIDKMVSTYNMYDNLVRSVTHYLYFVHNCTAKRLFLWGILVVFLPYSSVFAQNTPFTITGIPVETNGKTASEARSQAMLYAESRAFNLLMQQLTPPYAHNKLPKLSPKEIAGMVQGIEVEEEKVVGSHYRASLSVSFYPHYIRSLLETNSIALVQQKTPPLLILPVFTQTEETVLFEGDNAWSDAWNSIQLADSLINFSLPIGDLDDLTLVSAEMATSSNYALLKPIADKYNVTTILVAYAKHGKDPITQSPMLSVTLRRLEPENTTSTIASFTGNANDELPILLNTAAHTIITQLNNQWKIKEGASASSLKTFTVNVPFSSLYEWARIRRQLNNTSFIDKTTVISFTSRNATLTVHSRDSKEVLLRHLQEKGFGATLTGNGISLKLSDYTG